MAPPALVDIQQDEVLTGEAVALDVQPVAFLLRAVGLLIDVVVALLCFFLFLTLSGWLLANGILDGATQRMLLIIVAILVTVVVPTVVETVTRGRSLGKLAVGGRIVRSDGGATGFRHAFIRSVVGVLEVWMTLGAVAGVVGAFTPRSQRLGDLLAGTYSERTRTPKLPASAPGVPPILEGWAAVADVGRLPERLARRTTQFAHNAAQMAPVARERIATSLAAEVAGFVSPVPQVEPEAFLRAVAAVRRDRELRGLELETARVDALVAGQSDAPRGFPER